MAAGPSSHLQPKLEKVKRGYRACLHCRARKAKCDLGDIDAPSSPPCSRCRRESRECVFAPSRRGGNNRKRTKRESDAEDGSDREGDGDRSDEYPSHSRARTGYGTQPAQTFPYPYPPGGAGAQRRMSPSVSLHRQSPQSANYFHHLPNTGSSHSNLSPITQASPHTPSDRQLYPPGGAGAGNPSNTGNGGDPQRPSSTSSPKRRRLHLNPPLHAADPSSIVVADMQNESDALQILALASGQAAKQEKGSAPGGDASTRTDGQTNARGSRGRSGLSRPSTDLSGSRKPSQPPDLQDFALIRLGIITPEETMRLTDLFFRCYHHLFPMVPSAIIPRNPEQLAVFARKERYLLAAYIIIASRPDSTPAVREIHDRSWAVMRGWITDVQSLGAPPTIGFVEALLLLAENLPRTPPISGPEELAALGCREEPHGDENRQAWQMIGLAVRSAYEMGLDKIALRLLHDYERTLEIERARLAWTYCYLFDRHVSMRLGKGFWARGAAVCFQGFSSSAQTGPAAAYRSFPFLREIKPSPESAGAENEHPQEDLGSIVQAYLELTQMMSNAHDVLYPNSARTRSLVVHGEYFKYLDEMARSLDAFKLLWRTKKWTLFPLTDAMWTMFYYVQLYICAFSFQAHVERATIRAEEEYRQLQQSHLAKGDTTPLARPALSLFPRGAAASPDARYIFHMCDAARELLHICVNNLYPGGALPYLPSRFLLWFTYGAIVLLKALYSGAMLRGDHERTLELIDKLCECFGQCSADDDHPAVRYGRQLEALRKKLAGLSDATGTRSPTGGRTVPLPPIKSTTEKNGQAVDWDGSAHHLSGHARTANAHSTTRSTNAPSESHLSAHSEEYGHTPHWQLPPAAVQAQPIVFPYPTTPGPFPTGPHATHTSHASPILASSYVAPHAQQPILDIGVLQPQDQGFSLDPRGFAQPPDGNGGNAAGFGSTDDWFGSVGFGLGNNGGGGSGNGSGSGAGGGNEDGMGPLAGLDLQDFWMQVGPGEVSRL
ncbi:specific RNA polymerase II transcription factor [Kwoniella heveanensis BCC8398]|uniref:Specific RNA polymerase II transcription factor n=1 Tax=Kwoniella heveanensis BCC8398 TaxID=1296120 RepID=A0A1B9GT02_9TREE|nr:specific RNA polymerase II transcription factor [Kwoniella heveanensis BCC8398]